jgi:hypothetical protein
MRNDQVYSKVIGGKRFLLETRNATKEKVGKVQMISLLRHNIGVYFLPNKNYLAESDLCSSGVYSTQLGFFSRFWGCFTIPSKQLRYLVVLQ